MRIITIANQKGGVGKTTTAVNLAFGLARIGKATLLIDTDPQANATVAVLGRNEPEPTIYDLLIRDREIREIVAPSGETGLDLLPSEIDLAGVEAELVGQVGSQSMLRSRMRGGLGREYDYVIIDTPPSLGLMTLNALAASTEIIIPVSASYFALKGLSQLERTIDLVRERLASPELRITGVLCTFFDYTNVAKDVRNLLQKQYGQQAFETVIPKNVKVEEAHSRSVSVFDYAPDSKGAQAYQQFIGEVISRG